MSNPTGRTEPTPAERARSILAAATSLSATTARHHMEHLELFAVESTGRLLLAEPPGAGLRAELADDPRHRPIAALEFADAAPAPVRDRIRARLSLSGWLGPAEQLDKSGASLLAFHFVSAALAADGRMHEMGPDELLSAELDPLAVHEAPMLSHLTDHHPEAVAALTRLVDSRRLLGVTRVQPLRLDRYGIVLRLEGNRTTHDVRLPFRNPLRNPDDAGLRLQELLADAHAGRRRHRAQTTRP